ncbi:MAG: hypothetical protein WC992_04890 [Acholeplasmataceae bacterium]|jgi:hypothetical protein|nr:hypothetical protein [Acholeplasmataceae bacterium]
MKRKMIGFLIAAVIVSLLLAVQVLLVHNFLIGWEIAIFLGFSVISLIIVKFMFPVDFKYYILYPTSLLILYIPFNLVAGIYIRNGEIRQHPSYPRYEFILYYFFGMTLLYLLTILIDQLTQKKATLGLFITADIMSLGFVIFAVFATLFVSPHG